MHYNAQWVEKKRFLSVHSGSKFLYPFENPFNKEVLSNEDEIRLITPIKGVIFSQPVVWKEFEIVLDNKYE